jgi:hypothetical protein
MMYNLISLENYKIHHVKTKINFSNDIILNLYKEIKKTSDLLDRNVHPRLLVENILLLIP